MAESVADSSLLAITEHSRDSVGMTYVYPVVSRRAGGVSVGINLNPNNACNWRCMYCQVPNLRRGGPPPLNLILLEQELTNLLCDILQGGFMQRRVPEGSRQLMDVAFSGNGEPTSAPEFSQAVAVVAKVLKAFGLMNLPLRLITNGSLVDRANVREGLALLAENGGEVWFKVDAARAEDFLRINDTRVRPDQHLARLLACAAICPTWVQSCFFMEDGLVLAEQGLEAYLALMTRVVGHIKGVHLYGLARPSMQAEASRLAPLPSSWFDDLAGKLNEKGLTVTVSP